MQGKNNNKPKINLIKKFFIKNIYNVYKNVRNLSLFIVLIQSIVITSIIISEPVAFREFLNKLNRRILWSFDTLEIEDYGNYLKDFLFVLNPIERDLDRLDLSINYKNLKGLDCSRKFNSYANLNKIQKTIENCGKYWFKGKLTHDNNIYRVKIRSKGDRDIHYREFKNMSFKADIRGEERLKGMEEFSIQTPMIRNYTTELFAAKLMRNEGIVAPRNHYMRFYINGEYKGLRHIEESFSRELIEFNERRYGPLFSLEETIEKKYKGAYFDLHDSKYWNENINQYSLSNQARTILEESKTNEQYIETYFDLDKWAKYFALIDAFRLWHASMPKSVKYFLNPTTGLIEPVFFDGHSNSSRGLDNYNFYELLQKAEYQNNCEYICDLEDNFYKNFFGDNKNPNKNFYIKYITYLKKFTDKKYIEKNIEPIWNSLNRERGSLYKEFWRIDRINNPGIMPHVAPWKLMKNRLNNIQTKIKRSNSIKPEIIVNQAENKIISIENKFSDVPQVIKFKCNNFQSKNFILPRYTKINLTNRELDKCDIQKTIFSIDNFKSNYRVLEGYITDYELKYDLNNKTQLNKNKKLLFKRGKHNIKKNLTISNKDIYFSPGSKICLNEKLYIHIKNSKVYFSDSEKEAIYIDSCSDQKSGSLIIENSYIDINNLVVNKLTKPLIKLRSLDGGFNVINSKAKIYNFTSFNSFSEDAINFINSNIEANKLEINNAISDGIDSDFSEIDIKNIICKKIANDCFDSSFSKGTLVNLYAENVNDKVISIGESSEINIIKTKFLDSEIGLVVKDASKVIIDNLTFDNVRLPIASYIKKEEFGSPEISIYSIKSKDSNSKFLISNDSIFRFDNRILNSTLTSDYIEGILYGNEYGVKTKR